MADKNQDAAKNAKDRAFSEIVHTNWSNKTKQEMDQAFDKWEHANTNEKNSREK